MQGDKNDLVIEKCVELGATHIQPLFADNSVVKLEETRLAKRMEHWQSIVIAACAQCGRNRLPVMHKPVKSLIFFESKLAHQDALLFDPCGAEQLHTLAIQSSCILFATGPESGWSDRELSIAKQANWRLAKAGPWIMRAETAPIAILAILQNRVATD